MSASRRLWNKRDRRKRKLLYIVTRTENHRRPLQYMFEESQNSEGWRSEETQTLQEYAWNEFRLLTLTYPAHFQLVITHKKNSSSWGQVRVNGLIFGCGGTQQSRLYVNKIHLNVDLNRVYGLELKLISHRKFAFPSSLLNVRFLGEWILRGKMIKFAWCYAGA